MSKLLIDVDGERFVDGLGRHVILRGVNLGGDCKFPYPDGGTDRPSDFADHRTVSFVGRPFPLEEADEHLGRLTGWGFNVLRLLVTWEAVEHAGPGEYDEAYLDYVAEVAGRAGEHGLAVFIDFHQDVWSRMTGGDGAPGWVFEAVGLDFTRFDAAGAANVMQHRYDYASPQRRQEERYPRMSWAGNYRLPANGVMWSAFFAGAVLTPDWLVDGVNVQAFLQGHYLGAVTALAERLKDLPNVIGFDSLNEPGLGWVGQAMSQRRFAPTVEDPTPVHPGAAWTPFDALRTARGLTVRVPVLGPGPDGQGLVVCRERTVNPQGVSIWLDGHEDPFEAAGAWRLGDDGAEVLDEDFFRQRDGRPFDHERDFMQPFYGAVAAAIRSVRPDWLLFAELSPYVFGTGRGFPEEMPERSVNASHWYDTTVLRTKRFQATNDLEGVSRRYTQQLGYLRSLGGAMNGGAPTLIGEIGTPYDLDDGEAFRRWAAGERGEDLWATHTLLLGLMYDALDANLLSSTQWNYTASNRNDLRVGDGWNQEDLSIFSRDQLEPGTDGGRAVAGFCRPYVRAAQGRLTSMAFDQVARVFVAEIEADVAVEGPTEVFAPRGWYPDGVRVVLSDPEAAWSWSAERRVVSVRAARAGVLRVRVW